MSKPEFWWCMKNDAGTLLAPTSTKSKHVASKMRKDGFNIVRIRVEEVKESPDA